VEGRRDSITLLRGLTYLDDISWLYLGFPIVVHFVAFPPFRESKQVVNVSRLPLVPDH